MKINLSFLSHPLPFWKTSFVLFLCGLISFLGFAPYFCFPICLMTFAGLMYVLNQCDSKKHSFFYAFFFGAGLGITSLSWICQALMIDGGKFAFLIPVSLIGFGIFMGLFFACPALCASFTKKGVWRWLAFCCWFVLFEWIRSWFLTGFPWNLIGSIWTNYPVVLQSASIFGVYGLSLITLLFFTSFALLPYKKPLIICSIICLCLISGGAIRLYQHISENVIGVHLRIVQPNIPQTLKWNVQKAEENIDTLIRLSANHNDNITHVIWPESAIPYRIETVADLRLMSAVRQGATLITGGLRVVNREQKMLANSVFLINDMASVVGYADKSHLVPFGEYVPLRDVLPISKIVPISADFVSGQGIKTTTIPKAPPASLLVCYEIIFPGEVTDNNKKRRPQWIVNVTNDGWYGDSAGPHQHLGMAQMRAVEEGLPVIRSANTGISAVISPYGEILKQLPLNTQGIIDSELPRAAEQTIYGHYGNKPLLAFLIIAILFCCTQRNKKSI